MRLLVTTPEAILVDVADVHHVRAEDSTGAFGIQPGHAEFLTALTVSVVSHRDGEGVERYVAVRGGVLHVRRGAVVEVATSEGLAGDDLDALERAVMVRYRAESDAEQRARMRATQLHLLAIRSMYRYVRGDAAPLGPAHGEEDLG